MVTATLTPDWTPLRPHALQAAAWRTPVRYVALACGRGSGKSELARRRIVRYLAIEKPWRDPLYFYALPTVAQAKRIAWGRIKRLIPREWIYKINETDMHIVTVFGSELYVVGMDKPQRLEGVQWDGGVVDESSDQKPGIFERTLLPSFAHRNAWCWRIGVPKRQGIGAREFREFFEKGLSGKDPQITSFTWPSSDILSSEEIAEARALLDERDYAEQYEAKWQSASGAIFHAFDEVLNVSTELTQYRHDLPIIVGSDFNVDPMAWVLCQQQHIESAGMQGLTVFDEIFARNTNTQATLDALWQRYQQHKAGWLFIGDATGRARKTAASTTDYVQIANDKRFDPKRVLFPKANPAVVDRFSATNAMLSNADRKRRLLINPRCRNLIADLSNRAYKAGTREPDDSGDVGHITDALGYVCYLLYPPTLHIQPRQAVITTVMN